MNSLSLHDHHIKEGSEEINARLNSDGFVIDSFAQVLSIEFEFKNSKEQASFRIPNLTTASFEMDLTNNTTTYSNVENSKAVLHKKILELVEEAPLKYRIFFKNGKYVFDNEKKISYFEKN